MENVVQDNKHTTVYTRVTLCLLCCHPTDCLVVCHLPHGPTASFSLSNTVMRHDLPEVGTMSEAFPHLIFHNFKTTLGLRVCVCVSVCVCVCVCEEKDGKVPRIEWFSTVH